MMSLFQILSLVALLTRATWAFSSPTPANEINVQKAFAESTFPIQPADLIVRAKKILSPEIGIGTKDGGDCLADDFHFCAAVVGPLPKEEFLGALGTFKLEDSFDITSNNFGFVVSPVQTNRVYWFNYNVATMIAPFMGAKELKKDPLVLPPQCFHMDFDVDGKVTEFGFYTVDRQYGNTGGLGGAFGYFYGVGKALPIREGKPFKRSFRFRMLNLIGRLATKLTKKTKSS
jgi:hypothetical protein